MNPFNSKARSPYAAASNENVAATNRYAILLPPYFTHLRPSDGKTALDYVRYRRERVSYEAGVAACVRRVESCLLKRWPPLPRYSSNLRLECAEQRSNLAAKRVRARPPPTPLGSSQRLYPYVARDQMFIENGHIAGVITRLRAAPAQKE